MKYYLHSVDTMDDEKVSKLFKEFGYEGTGLFHAILEKIAKQEKPIQTDILKFQLKVGKKLNKIWKFMEEIELICSNNGETFNNNLLNFSETYQIKKEKTRKKVSEWRENQKVKKNVTDYVPVSNPPKVNESKVKESKVNKIIIEKPLWAFEFENFNNEILYPFEFKEFGEIWDLWIDYRKEKRLSKYKKIGEQAALKKLSEMSSGNIDMAKKIIEQSIANNWQGLFEIKNNGRNNNNQQPSKYRTAV